MGTGKKWLLSRWAYPPSQTDGTITHRWVGMVTARDTGDNTVKKFATKEEREMWLKEFEEE